MSVTQPGSHVDRCSFGLVCRLSQECGRDTRGQTITRESESKGESLNRIRQAFDCACGSLVARERSCTIEHKVQRTAAEWCQLCGCLRNVLTLLSHLLNLLMHKCNVYKSVHYVVCSCS